MSIARIRKGITVIVISGNDAGQTGKVLRVNRKDGTAVVEGLNRHRKAVRRTERTQGGLVDMDFPIRLCKLMPYDAVAKKGSRVATVDKDGKKALKLKTSGKEVDVAKTTEKGV